MCEKLWTLPMCETFSTSSTDVARGQSLCRHLDPLLCGGKRTKLPWLRTVSGATPQTDHDRLEIAITIGWKR
jgi:hypothetical protein